MQALIPISGLTAAEGNRESILGPDRKSARKRWAVLIKQVYETDPLLCPKCGGEMKIISCIERDPSEVFLIPE